MSVVIYKTLLLSILLSISSLAYSAKLLLNELPQSIQNKISDDMRSVFKDRHSSIQLEVLAGGLSGTPIYKVLDNDEVYVARVLDGNILSSRKTILFSRFAGEQGYGPKVYYPQDDHYDVDVMTTGLASGDLPVLSEFNKYKALLAESVRKMHQTPYDSLPASDEMPKRIRQHFVNAKDIGPFLDDIILVEKIDNTIKLHNTKYGFTHQDLTAGNILYDGKTFSFIDWPNGGFGDPIADVANLTFEFALTDPQALEFYKLYAQTQNPSKKDMAHFLLLRKMASFRLAAFAFEHIYQMGGVYKPMKPTHSIDELIHLARAGQFAPKTVDDFHLVLEASLARWRLDQHRVETWLKDIKLNN